MASSALSGLLLIVWRQHGQLWALWLPVWIVALAATAAAWYWLLRAGCRLCQRPELVSLREVPDSPLRPVETLRRWLRRGQAAPPP